MSNVYLEKGVNLISQWWYITGSILLLFLITTYIKTVVVNYRIMKTKEFKKFKWILTDYYVLLGPWTTKSLLAKTDKILSMEDEINEFYVSELKKQIKFRSGMKKIDTIIKVLNNKKLSTHERYILRSYIESDDVEDVNFMQIISLFVSMIVAIFVGVTAARLGTADNTQTYVTFFSALLLVAIYVISLFSLSRHRSKAKFIRIALDRYEKDIEALKINSKVAIEIKQN
ncbi:hypothetical protein [Paenibacillus sp. ALJ109b]|uniref:hypothetical protein n=1 Tax=Paenibacillus sp. ALJ109b TaxID=2709068 RepID=UPI0013D5098D|nr:hypothetical protein [Paenibacillus sp. ALJ109b]NEU59631.1 hypothetical protein [Paenibacillus sp. ALJ109b]